MAFILLLILTIVTLVQVESNSAEFSKQQLAARQNALLGLQLAIGELQKSLGPDQRVSATADILDDTEDSRRNAVGVWTSADVVIGGKTYNKGEIVNWLVSDAPKLADGSLDDSIKYNSDPSPTPEEDNAVVLVGTGSVNDADGNEIEIERVVVDASRTQIEQDGRIVGRYAWWIGDEGVKARVNLDSNAAIESTGAEEKFRTINAVSAFAKSDPTELTDLASLEYDENVDRINSLVDIKLLVDPKNTLSEDIDKRYFHDLTTYSSGVLSDTKNGGLKRDLSLAFEMDDADFNSSEFAGGGDDPFEPWPSAGFQIQPVFQFESSDYDGDGFDGIANGPAWHILRDYYRIYHRMQDPMENPTFEAQIFAPNFNHSIYSYPSDSGSSGRYQPGYLMAGGKANNGNFNVHDDNKEPPSQFVTLLRVADDAPMLSDGPTYDPLRSRGEEIPSIVSGTYMPYLNRQIGNRGIFFRPKGAKFQMQQRVQSLFTFHNPYNVSLSHGQIGVEADLVQVDYLLLEEDSINLVREDRTDPTSKPVIGFVRGDGTLGGAENRTVETRTITQPGTFAPGEIKTYPGFPKTENTPLAPVDVFDSTWKLITKNQGSVGRLFDVKSAGERFTLLVRPSENSNQIKEDQVNNEGAYAVIEVNSALLMRENGPSANNSEMMNDWSMASSFSTLFVGMGRQYDLETSDPTMRATSEFRMPLSVSFADPSGGLYDDYDYSFDFDVDPSEFSDPNAPLPVLSMDLQLKPTEYLNPNDMDMRYPVYAMTNPLAPVKDSRGFLPASDIRTDSSKLSQEGYPMVSPGWDINISRGSTGYAGVDYKRWGATDGGLTTINGSLLSNPVVLELPTSPILSIGKLQHANITVYDHMPALAIGNSFASPYIPKDRVYSVKTNRYNHPRIYYDISYLMNEALWDSYFFSSISIPYDSDDDDYDEAGSNVKQTFDRFTDSADPTPLPNPRMELSLGKGENLTSVNGKLFDSSGDPADDAYLRAAENLMVRGSFNINSTSVEAWTAVLSGARGLPVFSSSGTDDPEFPAKDSSVPFTRVSQPIRGELSAIDIGQDEAWGGFRTLDEDQGQIKTLAENIVAQIKARVKNQNSPFLSMADFVNRSLRDDEFGLAGVLQAAIDESGNDINGLLESNTEIPRDFLNGSEPTIGTSFPDPTNLERYDGRDPSAALTSPAYFLQGDILQAIGSFISVRSDTFRIRSYGEYIDPLTSESGGKVWCEAVLQRVPELVDASGGTNPLGRKFQIISFRWLSEDEV